MSTKAMQGQFSEAYAPNMTWVKSYMLKRFHPRKIFFDVVAMMWGVYFLWNQDWQRAVLVAVGVSLIGTLSVLNVDPYKMAKTSLGKMGLLHLHPFNAIVQLVGIVPLIYGTWMHSPEYMLVGASLVLIGHIFGWDKVNSNFTTNDSDRGIL